MNRLVKLVAFLFFWGGFVVPAVAQEAELTGAEEAATTAGVLQNGLDPGGAFGAALVVIGAAYGISRIGAAAVESMSRQPEVAGNIQTAMLISAAMIEGAAFFALIVCLLSIYT